MSDATAMIRSISLAFLLGMAGCGGGITDPGSVSGTYTLQTIDAFELPAFLQFGPPSIQVTAGSLTLNQDLTCSHSLTFRVTDNGTTTTPTETNACTYTLDGGLTVTVPDPPGNPSILAGAVTGSSLWVTDDAGFTFVFEK